MIELSAKASEKSNLSLKIDSYQPEVLNSASIDLEWSPYKGRYSHEKTRIFAAGFCTNWGERIVLHISDYLCLENPEMESDPRHTILSRTISINSWMVYNRHRHFRLMRK